MDLNHRSAGVSRVGSATLSEAGGGIHELFELGGMEPTKALGIDVFMDASNGFPIGEMFEGFEHEGGGTSAQGNRGTALVLAVEFLKGGHQGFPVDGGGEFEQRMFGIKDHIHEGQFSEVGLRVVGCVQGSVLLGESDLGVEFENLETGFPPAVVVL